MLPDLIDQFVHDPGVITVAILVLLNFVLGVTAAVVNRAQTFNLGYLADFLRADVLGKVIPYFAVWMAARAAGDIVIPGIDIGVIEEGTLAVVVAAMAASIFASLKDLGLGGSTLTSMLSVFRW